MTGKGVIDDLRAGDLLNLNLKVSHDFGDTDRGKARIPTHDASRILNNEGKDIFMTCLILCCLMKK